MAADRRRVVKAPVGEWADRRACVEVEPAMFFVERGDTAGANRAKAICAGCEVRAECLAYALTSPRERFGIWGGLTVKDRRSLHLGDPIPPVRFTEMPAPVESFDRRRRAIPHGTEAGYRGHQRHGEAPCDQCRAAHSQFQKSKPSYQARLAERRAVAS